MICELCKGKGWVQGQAPDIPTACSACGGKGFVDMTNEEWRKTCSIEEFAEFISDVVFNAIVDYRIDKNNCEKEDGNYWLKWLKQPHHEKE